MPFGRLHYGIAGEDGKNLLGFVPFLNSPADSRNANDPADGIAKVQAMLDQSGFLQTPFKALKYQIETKEFDEDGTYKVKESFDIIIIMRENLDQERPANAQNMFTAFAKQLIKKKVQVEVKEGDGLCEATDAHIPGVANWLASVDKTFEILFFEHVELVETPQGIAVMLPFSSN